MWPLFQLNQTSHLLLHLDGVVNSHNNIYWDREVPRETNQKPLHSLEGTAWCALSVQ